MDNPNHVHVDVRPSDRDTLTYEITLNARLETTAHMLEAAPDSESFLIEKLLRMLAGEANRARLEDCVVVEGLTKRRPGERRKSRIWGSPDAMIIDDIHDSTRKRPEWQDKIMQMWLDDQLVDGKVFVSLPRQHGRTRAQQEFRSFYEQYFDPDRSKGMGTWLVLSNYDDGATRITKVRARHKEEAIEKAIEKYIKAESIKGVARDVNVDNGSSTSFEAVRVIPKKRYVTEFGGRAR